MRLNAGGHPKGQERGGESRDGVARVRLVATDLDGTLLRTDGTVSPRTRAALAGIRRAGIVLVLVTARPPRFLRRLAEAEGLAGLAICCNGALVYDLDRGEIVRHRPLGAEAAGRLVAGLREAAPGGCFAVEAGERYGWEPAYAALAGALVEPGGVAGDALALCRESVTKLIVRHPALAAEALLPLVRRIAGDAAYATHSGAPFVEVAAAGVQKAAALAALCADLGVAAGETIAFGDMPNDLPLLRWAGYAVAVANAHPEVLRAADEVTLANGEDGVAVVLERLLAAAGTARRATTEARHWLARLAGGAPPGVSWLAEGEVAACAYPRDEAALAGLASQGVTLLINLHERAHDPAILARHGLAERHLPVRDFTPPTPAQLAEGVAAIEGAVAAGGRVAVHCGAGLGRTGTLLACYLARRGLPAGEAIARVRAARPGAVETAGQVAAVEAFAAALPRPRTPPGG